MLEKEVLSLKQTASFLGCSKAQLWKIRNKEPSFPKPIKFTESTPKFFKSELIDWLRSKQQSKSGGCNE